MVALILAGGEAPERSFLDTHWPWWYEDVGLVVAADGGARHATPLGLTIDVWVGDGDSTDAADLAILEDAGVAIERSPADKDETDTELAIRAALARDAGGVIIIGATGGLRIDHELANIALLAMPELIGNAGILYTPRSMIRLLRGTGIGPSGTTTWMQLQGAAGDIVSFIPFGGDAGGVTTGRLRYPLRGETLPLGAPRGISNVIESSGSSVGLADGLLLVIESPATIEP